MTDDQSPAPAAGDEVVQPEAEQVEAAEAPESTEGQEDIQPAEDSAEGDQSDAESEEEISESKKRRERRKAHERELRERAEKAERELAEHQESQARIQEAAQSNKRPEEADFQDYQEFLMAVSAWNAGQEFDKRQQAEIQRKAEDSQKTVEELRRQQQEAALESWAAQSDDARTRYADFDAVISAPDAAFTETISDIIRASDVGADVAYHLGMNKAELRKLADMTPIEQAMAIGRLEATVSTPKPRTVSSAPEPVKPVKAKATATKAVEEMSMSEYAAARKAGKI